MANNNPKQNAPETEVQLTKNEQLVQKYWKKIIIAIVAVVVIILAAFAINNYVIKPRADKASTALAKGQDYFMQGDFEKALNGDKAGYAGFKSIADEYSSTDAGNLAKLYSGLCYAQLGKWNEAISNLEDFSTKDDQMISPAALGALGNAYAHVNKLDDAVKTLKKAAEKADNNSLSPTFLVQAGEILESQGKKAEALELYKQVKSKYMQSMAYQTIDKYIERASN